MKIYKVSIVPLLLFIGMLGLKSDLQAQDTYLNPSTDMKLLKQFQDAKLGMFVHWMACFSPETSDSWGIGSPVKPKSVSDSITLAWNPYNFDAKQMVQTAVDLGCKYMVVISKHHDGYSIWPTAYSEFNITKGAFKRDILKELGAECKRQGLLYGIYYSIADIDYAGWTKMATVRSPIPSPVKGIPDFVEFNKNQVKELITNYDPDILWFDGYWLDPDIWNADRGRDLYHYIKSIKPNTLSTRLAITYNPENPDLHTAANESFVNDGSAGDFFAVEARSLKAPIYPWEGCTSVSYPVYAYNPAAKLHTREELILDFDKMVCANGNFLLNIGPKDDGTLPEELVARFGEMSQWAKQNAKGIYNTKGGPFIQDEWGGSTYAKNKIYLHLRAAKGILLLPALTGYQVKHIKSLAKNQKVKFRQLADGQLEVTIPADLARDTVTFLEITLDKEYVFQSWISV